MDSQRRCVRKVSRVAAFFGASFLPARNRKGVIVAIVLTQVYFIAYSSLLASSSMLTVKNAFKFMLLCIPVILPILLEVLTNTEAFMKVQVDVKIENHFKELNEVLREKFNLKEVPGVEFYSTLFILKFLILIVVRCLKIIYSGYFYSLTTMVTELVLSACEYKFCFDVDLLRSYIKAYSRSVVEDKPTKKLNFRHHYLIFYKLSKLISRRYALSMFLIITFNFITVILNFYWVFIRTVYGGFNVLR